MNEETNVKTYRLVLPEDVADAVRDLATRNDPTELENYLAHLHHAGWTYQSMATVLDRNRQYAHYRASRGSVRAALPSGVPKAPAVPPKPQRPDAPSLRPHTRERLAELHALAVKLRGHHAADDPVREASEELSRLLDAEHRRGVPYRVLAEAMGVRPMTVRGRLKRHSYLKPNPALTPYAGASIQKEA